MRHLRHNLCEDPCQRPGCSNLARPGGAFCSSTCCEAKAKRGNTMCSDCGTAYQPDPNSRGTRCPRCVKAAKRARNAEYQRNLHARKVAAR